MSDSFKLGVVVETDGLWKGGIVAEPGWYPDPSGTLGLRFWDGLRWTEKVSAAAEQTTQAVGRSSAAASTALANGGLRWRVALLLASVLGVVASASGLLFLVGLPPQTIWPMAAAMFILGIIGSLAGLRYSNRLALSLTGAELIAQSDDCLLYTSPSPRDATLSRMPSSA